MNTDEVLAIMDTHLQEVNSNPKERAERIQAMLEFLNFNLRLTELSEDEKVDFLYSQEGYPPTDEMKKKLENCTTDKERENYIDMWARSTYFRRCAWLQYLTGVTQEKPTVLSQSIDAKAA